MGYARNCSQELFWIVSNIPVLKVEKYSKAHFTIMYVYF